MTYQEPLNPIFSNAQSIVGKIHPCRNDTPKGVAKPIKVRSEQKHLNTLFDAGSFQQHFQPQRTILLDGDPADTIYQIVSGTARCCTIDSDGARQIFSFAKKGDFIGISDIDTWHFTAEAVDHVIFKSIPRSSLEQALAVNIS